METTFNNTANKKNKKKTIISILAGCALAGIILSVALPLALRSKPYATPTKIDLSTLDFGTLDVSCDVVNDNQTELSWTSDSITQVQQHIYNVINKNSKTPIKIGTDYMLDGLKQVGNYSLPTNQLSTSWQVLILPTDRSELLIGTVPATLTLEVEAQINDTLPNAFFNIDNSTLNGFSTNAKVRNMDLAQYLAAYPNCNTLSIPSNISNVSYRAFLVPIFYNTTIPDQLTNMNFKNSNGTSIGQNAFTDSPLSSVDFTNVTTIDGSAFDSSALSGVLDLHNISSFLDINQFFDCHVTSIIFPSSIQTIPNSFVRGNNIVDLDLSQYNQLTTIKNSAFENSTSLRSISFPSSITTLEGYSYNAGGLAGSTISEITTEWPNGFNDTGINKYFFSGLSLVSNNPSKTIYWNGQFKRTGAGNETTDAASIITWMNEHAYKGTSTVGTFFDDWTVVFPA